MSSTSPASARRTRRRCFWRSSAPARSPIRSTPLCARSPHSPRWFGRAAPASRFRFTAALSDGADLYAFRYANNDTANSLYYREAGGNVVVVSEPLDTERTFWKPVPPSHYIAARGGKPVVLEPFPAFTRVAAE